MQDNGCRVSPEANRVARVRVKVRSRGCSLAELGVVSNLRTCHPDSNVSY